MACTPLRCYCFLCLGAKKQITAPIFVFILQLGETLPEESQGLAESPHGGGAESIDVPGLLLRLKLKTKGTHRQLAVLPLKAYSKSYSSVPYDAVLLSLAGEARYSCRHLNASAQAWMFLIRILILVAIRVGINTNVMQLNLLSHAFCFLFLYGSPFILPADNPENVVTLNLYNWCLHWLNIKLWKEYTLEIFGEGIQIHLFQVQTFSGYLMFLNLDFQIYLMGMNVNHCALLLERLWIMHITCLAPLIKRNINIVIAITVQVIAISKGVFFVKSTGGLLGRFQRCFPFLLGCKCISSS